MRNSTKKHYSPSQLSEYLSCPRRYMYSRVQKLIPLDVDLSNVNMEFGTAIHEALNVYFTIKIKTGKEADREALNTCFVVSLENELTKNKKLAHLTPKFVQALKAKGAVMLFKYIDEIGCRIDPVLTELDLEYTLDISPVPVFNRVDLIRRGENGWIIEDFKTSSMPYSEDDIRSSLQLRSYAYAVYKHFPGEIIEGIQYSVLLKSGGLQIMYMPLKEGWIQDFEMDAQHIIAGMEAGLYPKNPVPKGYKCKHCPFYAACWGAPKNEKIVTEIRIK